MLRVSSCGHVRESKFKAESTCECLLHFPILTSFFLIITLSIKASKLLHHLSQQFSIFAKDDDTLFTTIVVILLYMLLTIFAILLYMFLSSSFNHEISVLKPGLSRSN